MTEKDVPKPSAASDPILAILSRLLRETLPNLRSGETIYAKLLERTWALSGFSIHGERIAAAEIEKALQFLSSPPLQVLRRLNGEYALEVPAGILQESFGMLFAAMRWQESPTARIPSGVPAGKLPPVPRVSRFNNKTHESFYRQLHDPENLACKLRAFIFEKRRVTAKDLEAALRTWGYAKSGAVSASLKVLADVTHEIRIDGRGDSRVITWVGGS